MLRCRHHDFRGWPVLHTSYTVLFFHTDILTTMEGKATILMIAVGIPFGRPSHCSKRFDVLRYCTDDPPMCVNKSRMVFVTWTGSIPPFYVRI